MKVGPEIMYLLVGTRHVQGQDLGRLFPAHATSQQYWGLAVACS